MEEKHGLHTMLQDTKIALGASDTRTLHLLRRKQDSVIVDTNIRDYLNDMDAMGRVRFARLMATMSALDADGRVYMARLIALRYEIQKTLERIQRQLEDGGIYRD